MGQVGTSLLDTITRIYKNSNGKVIGVHCISVNEKREANPTSIPGEYGSLAERRKRGLHLSVSFQRFNLDMGGSRVVDSVLMLGGYDDFVMNGSSNDILSVTYDGRDDENLENDLIVGLSEFPTIGATL